jgi:hypothetical protein
MGKKRGGGGGGAMIHICPSVHVPMPMRLWLCDWVSDVEPEELRTRRPRRPRRTRTRSPLWIDDG